jgi:hypothetical protein
MEQAQAIDAIWMPRALLDAVVRDTDASFRLQFVICKREKGKQISYSLWEIN